MLRCYTEYGDSHHEVHSPILAKFRCDLVPNKVPSLPMTRLEITQRRVIKAAQVLGGGGGAF
jgi:hypothetical protein